MYESKPEILIVDDNSNNHHVYERILESMNLNIEKAMSGQQALKIAHRKDFFLILMDVQMPDMDGFETADLLRNHPKTSHIRPGHILGANILFLENTWYLVYKCQRGP